MKNMGNRIALVFGLCLTVVCVALLVPQCMELARVEEDIRASKVTRYQQQTLEPLQTALAHLVSRPSARGLQAAVRTPLQAKGLRSLPELFEAPARRTGLALIRFDSDVQGLPAGAYKKLGVTLAVSGSCSGFQQYLVELCRLPFLAELRHVSIRRVGPKAVEMTVAATLSVRG